MSRIGNRELVIPNGVNVSKTGTLLTVQGKLGKLELDFNPLIAVEINDNKIITIRADEAKSTKQIHGTTNSLIKNMLVGVSEGYKQEIIIKGVGYKFVLKGNEIEVSAGYSHPVMVQIPEGIKVEIPKPLEMTVTSCDKEKIGQFVADIKKIRRPNPYSGKGIMLKDEVVRRKEGKTAAVK